MPELMDRACEMATNAYLLTRDQCGMIPIWSQLRHLAATPPFADWMLERREFFYTGEMGDLGPEFRRDPDSIQMRLVRFYACMQGMVAEGRMEDGKWVHLLEPPFGGNRDWTGISFEEAGDSRHAGSIGLAISEFEQAVADQTHRDDHGWRSAIDFAFDLADEMDYAGDEPIYQFLRGITANRSLFTADPDAWKKIDHLAINEKMRKWLRDNRD